MFRRRAKEETVAERWSRSADEWEEPRKRRGRSCRTLGARSDGRARAPDWVNDSLVSLRHCRGGELTKGRKARRRVAVLISLPSANDRRAYSLQHLGWRWAGNTNSTIYPNYSTYGCTRNTDKKPLKIIGREWHGQWKSRIKRGWNRSHVATHRPTIRRWCGIEFIFFFLIFFVLSIITPPPPKKLLIKS